MDVANAVHTARSPAGYTGSIRFPELCGQSGLQPSPKHVLRSAGEGFRHFASTVRVAAVF